MIINAVPLERPLLERNREEDDRIPTLRDRLILTGISTAGWMIGAAFSLRVTVLVEPQSWFGIAVIAIDVITSLGFLVSVYRLGRLFC